MRINLARIGVGFFIILFTACATVDDVQRASDLIRTDNELARLLKEVRPGDQEGSSVFLTVLAADASEKAKLLGNSADAIAFYRIAATAYWKSDKPEFTDKLFAVVGSGQEACGGLGDRAPDRDCLFLQFVIPFAAIESESRKLNYDAKLKKIDFFDQLETGAEIKTLDDTSGYLHKIKKSVKSILNVGSDDVLLSHTEMKLYYCDNAKKALKTYNNIASNLYTKTVSYHKRKADLEGSHNLEFDAKAVDELRDLDQKLTEKCN